MKYAECNHLNRRTWRAGWGRRAANGGQTLVEYAMILAIISIVAVGVMINLGKQTTGLYSTISSTVASANGSH